MPTAPPRTAPPPPRPGPEEFWHEHRAGVVRYAATLLSGDVQLAEDVAQETAVRLCQHLEVLDRPGSVRGWLRTVARNVVIDWHRRHRDSAVPAGGPEDLPVSGAVPDPADEVAGGVDSRRLLAGLDEPRRAVVEAVYLDGLTMQAAADRLGVPVGTVKSRSHHAVKELRGELEAAGGGGQAVRWCT